MSKTSKTITYSDKVKFKDVNGSSNDVYVIKDKNGKAIWQRGKVVTISTNGHMTVEATKVDIDKNTTRQTANSPYIVRAGESVTFSATPNIGYELTSSSVQQYNLSNLSNLGESSFNAATATFTSRQSTIVTTLHLNYIVGEHTSVVAAGSTVSSGGSTSFTVNYDTGYQYDFVAVEGTYGKLNLLSSDAQSRNYEITNITSDLIITTAAKIKSTIEIKDILNIEGALFEKFDPDVVKIDLRDSGWIIEPIEPIYKDNITFRISPAPIDGAFWPATGDQMYLPLPSGVKVDLTASTGVTCSYKLEQRTSDDMICGYLTFSGTLDANDIGRAQLVFNSAPKISLNNITSTYGEYTNTTGLVSGGGSLTNIGPDGSYSFEVGQTYYASRTVDYDVNGSSEYVEYASNTDQVVVDSPAGSFWAVRDPDSFLVPNITGNNDSTVGWKMGYSTTMVNGSATNQGMAFERYYANPEDFYSDTTVLEIDFTEAGDLNTNSSELKLCSLDSPETQYKSCFVGFDPHPQGDASIPIRAALIPADFVEQNLGNYFSDVSVEYIQQNYIQLANVSALNSSVGNYHLLGESSSALHILFYVTQEELGPIDVDSFFFPGAYRDGNRGLIQDLNYSGSAVINDDAFIIDRAAGTSTNSDWSGFVITITKTSSEDLQEIIIQDFPLTVF